jgi:hypothetical protein
LKTKAVVAGVLVFASFFAPARGEHKTVLDGNDTQGRADIRSIRMENGSPRKWFFRTWRGWRVRDFFEQGYFVLYFDTFGNKRFDYFVFVRAKRKRLGAALWRDRRAKDDVRLRNVNARKAGNRLVRVAVPFGKMRIPNQRLKYRWFGRSIWSGPSCRRLCLDRAPNNKVVSELLVPNP